MSEKRLASLGHTVVGIEFVEEAIEQFFAENSIKFSAKTVDDFKVFTVVFSLFYKFLISQLIYIIFFTIRVKMDESSYIMGIFLNSPSIKPY